MRQNALLVGLSLMTAAVGLNGPLAEAATFSNAAAITINDNANASLYPSTINVGTNVPIQSIAVLLSGFSHTRISDLTILLVSPTGKKVQLLANAPGSAAAPLPLTIADAGTALNGDPLSKIAYRPTVVPTTVLMPAPAPGLPYETSFASLIGDDAIGTWSLYIRDNVSGETGLVSGGWSLGINTAVISPVSSEFVYQGVLKDAAGPISGTYDVRADLWRSPTSEFAGDKVASSTSFAVTLENGVFTTRFSPPTSALSAGRALWVEIAVKGPTDPDFVTLSGRQPLAATPFATYALFAQSAEFADNAGSVSYSNIVSVPPNVANAFSPWLSQAGNAIGYSLGNVLIGTTTGTSKLTVNGTIESLTGGVKFPDDTVQTTAAVTTPSPVVGGTTSSINFPSIAAGAEAAGTLNFAPGSFLTTDVVVVCPTSDLPADVSITFARVVNATQCRFVLRNNGTAAVDPPLIGFSFRVIR